MDPNTRTPTKDRPAMPPTHTETPHQRKPSQVAASAPGHLGTAAKRENTLLDLGQSVPQVPIEWFTDANGILPPLKDTINLAQVVDQLKKEKHIKEVIKRLKDDKHLKEERWSFFNIDPIEHPDVENTVFHPVQQIADAIQKASGLKKLSPTLFFRCNPDMSPDSSSRPDNKTKPDAYGVLASRQIDPARGGKPRWIDVAVPGEFKKSPASNQDVDVSTCFFCFSFAASVPLANGSPIDGI